MHKTLQTARMLLTPATAEDEPLFYQLHSSPAVMRYISGGVPQTREEVSEYVKTVLQKTEAFAPYYHYWIARDKENDTFLGWFILKPLDTSNEIELGYRLMEHAWGKGLASEGSLEILRFGFKNLQLQRIVGVALPENKASIRVLEKCGLQQQGTGTYYGKECVYLVLENEYWQKLESNC